MGFGGVGWTVPSNMARDGHLYSYDSFQNATFPASVNVAGTIKQNGTAVSLSNHTHTVNKTNFSNVTISDETLDLTNVLTNVTLS